MGSAWSRWFATDGKAGTRPQDPDMLRVYDLMRAAGGQPETQRSTTAQEIWRIVANAKWQIGLVGQAPGSQGAESSAIALKTCLRVSASRTIAVHPGARGQSNGFSAERNTIRSLRAVAALRELEV
jgi:hypothetical protein